MSQPLRPAMLFAMAAFLLVLSGCGKPGATSAEENIADTDITNHVTTALHERASLAQADITVVTKKGDVRLTGTLDSQAQIDEALGIARAVNGAHTIHDELTLKNAQP
jgi:hyperosmotically inducible periplasmic protein